jgi:hypothetical protein
MGFIATGMSYGPSIDQIDWIVFHHIDSRLKDFTQIIEAGQHIRNNPVTVWRALLENP